MNINNEVLTEKIVEFSFHKGEEYHLPHSQQKFALSTDKEELGPESNKPELVKRSTRRIPQNRMQCTLTGKASSQTRRATCRQLD
jgi:hypothetical protein